MASGEIARAGLGHGSDDSRTGYREIIGGSNGREWEWMAWYQQIPDRLFQEEVCGRTLSINYPKQGIENSPKGPALTLQSPGYPPTWCFFSQNFEFSKKGYPRVWAKRDRRFMRRKCEKGGYSKKILSLKELARTAPGSKPNQPRTSPPICRVKIPISSDDMPCP